MPECLKATEEKKAEKKKHKGEEVWMVYLSLCPWQSSRRWRCGKYTDAWKSEWGGGGIGRQRCTDDAFLSAPDVKILVLQSVIVDGWSVHGESGVAFSMVAN